MVVLGGHAVSNERGTPVQSARSTFREHVRGVGTALEDTQRVLTLIDDTARPQEGERVRGREGERVRIRGQRARAGRRGRPPAGGERQDY